MSMWHLRGTVPALGLLALPVCTLTLPAQQPPREKGVRVVTVPYAPGSARVDGFEQASVDVEYGFNICGGDLVLGARIDRSSFKARGAYWHAGVRVPRDEDSVEPRRPAGVRFVGKVLRNGAVLAPFRMEAGASLGFNCFSGDYITVAPLKSLVPPRATREQLRELASSLSITIEPAPPLRDAAIAARAAARPSAPVVQRRNGLVATLREMRPTYRKPFVAAQLANERADAFLIVTRPGTSDAPIILAPGERYSRQFDALPRFDVQVWPGRYVAPTPSVIDAVKASIRKQILKDSKAKPGTGRITTGGGVRG